MSQDKPGIKIYTKEELDEIIRPMTESEKEEFLSLASELLKKEKS
jgi:hypothetical protein